MKKKLISLLLCVAMLLSFVMVSCNISTEEPIDEEEEEKDGVRSAMTLVWALICEEVPSEKTQDQIEKAVNKITESRYTTHIELEFYTEDDYSEVVEKKLIANGEEAARAEEAKKAWRKFLKANRVIKYEDGSTYKVETEELYEMFWESYPDYEKYVQPEETTDEDYTETEAETVLNDWGIGVLAYPEARENQVDIIYVSGYDNYIRYINNEWLATLNEALTDDAQVLSDYIFPAFLTAADTLYGTYAIPNNNTIGDYTYLLLHKELIEKYYYVPENITGLTSSLCQDFLYDVLNTEAENFVPLLDNEATRTPQNVKFWGLDVDENGDQSYANVFSVLGSSYARTATQLKDGNSVYQCMILLNDSSYTNQLKTLKRYECEGYYGAGAEETRTFAAGIVVGDMTDLVPKYSQDYHMIVVDYPRGTEEDLFAHMWGVSAYCEDMKRAMEIITYLNTNEDFRNLIQYGIEGDHYTVDPETGIAHILNDEYQMDINKTGNVFLAYPEEGMNADAWVYGKEQNQNAKVDLCIGFSLKEDDYILNEQGIQVVKLWSDRLKAALDAAVTPEDIDMILSGFTLEQGTDLSTLSDLQKLLLEYSEITDSSSLKVVSGFLGLLKNEDYIQIMTDSGYDPTAAYEEDENGQVLSTFADQYGYGESLCHAYREWAKRNKYLIESGT